MTGKCPGLLIVGTGHGARIQLPAARAAGFSVEGLVARDAARTRKIADRTGVPGAFGDLAEAIGQTGATAVAIAGPPATHYHTALEAIERGCHVYCEKPLALDAKQAEAMLDAAQRAGVVHAVGNQMRMLPARRAVAAAIAQGLIGKPRMITLVLHTALLAQPGFRMPAWFYREEEGGGWLNASGSHMIDMVRAWFGEFASISATLDPMLGGEETADGGFTIHFELAGGAAGIIQQTGLAHGTNVAVTRVVGTRATVEIVDDRAFVSDDEGRRELDHPPPELDTVEPSDHPRERYRHLELPPSIAAFRQWRSAIEGSGNASGLANFADGLATMRVIDAVRGSARSGKTRKVEHRAEGGPHGRP